MPRSESVFDLEKFFVALSDRTRLRLLNLMGEDEVCVCFFVEILQENQSKISRHLAYLRKAGLVSSRKDGKWTHYRITTPADPVLRQNLVTIDIVDFLQPSTTLCWYVGITILAVLLFQSLTQRSMQFGS